MRQCLLPAPRQGFEEHLQRSQKEKKKVTSRASTKALSILTHVVLACQRKLYIIKELRTGKSVCACVSERDRMKIKSE